MNFNTCCSRKDKVTIDKWTNNITGLIANDGKERFKDFLLSRDLDEAFLTVVFWEKCDSLQKEIAGNLNVSSAKINIYNAVKEVINFADENVNFDEAEMTSLKKMLNEKDLYKIHRILENAKGSALKLLHNEHKMFSELLIKEYNSCCR